MGTGPINNASATPTPATRRNEPAPAAPQPQAAPQHARAPQPTRDTAHTGPLSLAVPAHDLDLEKIHVPPPPKEEHSLLGSIWGGITGAAHAVEHAAGATVHAVEHAAGATVHAVEHAAVATAHAVGDAASAVGHGVAHAATATVHAAEAVAHVTADVARAGVHGVEEGLAHGDGLIGSLGDGLSAAGSTAMNEAVDPIMTNAVGKADKANDTAAGALGPLLTNRLAVGDSVDIKIEAGATLPTELVGAPNIKLDGGGMLKIKRVAAQDANGQPIIGADGKPETRLEVELQAYGRAGAAYSAGIGTEMTVGGMGHDVGFKASASATAEAGLSGKLDLKLRFNPNSEKDMGDLLALTKSTAETGAVGAIPGVGPLMAAMPGGAYQQSMSLMGAHLEEVGGEGGLYAQASASAKLGLGVFKAAPANDPNAPADPNKPTIGEEIGKSAVDNAHNAALSKMNVTLANVAASVGAQGTVACVHNYRTGETTYTITAAGSLNAGGSVLGAGKQEGVAGNRKVNLVFGKDGSLKDVTVSQSMTKTEFQGALTTVQDVFGRPINPGVIAGIGKSDTITVNYKLKPDLVNQIRNASGMQGITDAAMAVSSAAITRDRFKLDVGDIVTDHREQVDFHFAVGVSFFAQVGTRAGIVLGHDQERVIDS